MASDVELRGKLIRLGMLNNLSAAVTLITGLVMVPIMLAGLGSQSYGVWIMIISLTGLVMSMDLGLGLIITRGIARSRYEEGAGASPVVQAAGAALVMVGIFGALVMVGLGFAAKQMGWLGQGAATVGLLVFTLVGIGLLADQVIQYAVAVFSAHLRFGLGNLILSASTLLRAVLLTTALVLRPGLVGVACANAGGAVLTAVGAALVLRHVDARHALATVRFDWRALRPQLQFGLSSLLATLAGALLWQIHPLMIGMFVGPAAVVAFFVGMRLPMLVSEINWRTAEVLFPAVSGGTPGSQDSRHAAVALSTGVRWLTLLVLPMAVMGFVLARPILDAWLIHVPDGAVTILRLGVVVMLLDAWAVSALQVLWGLGNASSIAMTMGSAAVTAIMLNFALLPVLGAPAAPIAMIVGLTILAGLSLAEAARRTGLALTSLLARDIAGLLPAGALCAAATVLGRWVAGDAGSLAQAVLGALLGMTGYVVAIRFSGSVTEERMILGHAFGRLGDVPGDVLRAFRARAKGVKALRSAWYLLIVVRQRLAYRATSTAAALDELFDKSPDPWRYDSPGERIRHDIAEEIISRIEDASARDRVLEIGCAEGAFTERLAGHSRSLLSLDVSVAAIEHARRRRAWGNAVRFARFDLLRDEIPGSYTLVVVMDVLTYFQSVSQLRAIREKIVDVVEPGGWILVGDVRQSEVFETSWWGKRLLCGGLRICEFMAEHEKVLLKAQAETDSHVFRLLRKST